MDAWTLHKTGAATPSRGIGPVVCRSYADLLLQLRVEWHAAPTSIFEVVIPKGADPDAVRALRRRGCVVRYRDHDDREPGAGMLRGIRQ